MLLGAAGQIVQAGLKVDHSLGELWYLLTKTVPRGVTPSQEVGRLCGAGAQHRQKLDCGMVNCQGSRAGAALTVSHTVEKGRKFTPIAH